MISLATLEMIACRNFESALINAPASRAWSIVRKLDFAQLNPTLVKSCCLLVPTASMPESSPLVGKILKLEDSDYHDVPISDAFPFMCASALGSLRHVLYKDGAEFVFRVIEISDVKDFITFELIQTDSTVNVSGMQHTIQVIEITETKQCVITWTTEFSSDIDQHVYSDSKYKKLDAFKDIRKALE